MAFIDIWYIFIDQFALQHIAERPGVKTFKLLRPGITELDPFLKKPEYNFLLLLLSNYGRRFWRSWLLELRTQLFILLRS